MVGDHAQGFIFKVVDRQGLRGGANQVLKQINFVVAMHDEGQSEVRDIKINIELYSEAAVESITKAGLYYNLNIHLDAEAKVGLNWADTH